MVASSTSRFLAVSNRVFFLVGELHIVGYVSPVQSGIKENFWLQRSNCWSRSLVKVSAAGRMGKICDLGGMGVDFSYLSSFNQTGWVLRNSFDVFSVLLYHISRTENRRLAP